MVQKVRTSAVNVNILFIRIKTTIAGRVARNAVVASSTIRGNGLWTKATNSVKFTSTHVISILNVSDINVVTVVEVVVAIVAANIGGIHIATTTEIVALDVHQNHVVPTMPNRLAAHPDHRDHDPDLDLDPDLNDTGTIAVVHILHPRILSSRLNI